MGPELQPRFRIGGCPHISKSQAVPVAADPGWDASVLDGEAGVWEGFFQAFSSLSTNCYEYTKLWTRQRTFIYL